MCACTFGLDPEGVAIQQKYLSWGAMESDFQFRKLSPDLKGRGDKTGESGGRRAMGRLADFLGEGRGLVPASGHEAVTRSIHQPRSRLPNLEESDRKDTCHLCSSGRERNYFEPRQS